MITNPSIVIDGDRAVARYYSFRLDLDGADGGPCVAFWGRWTDHLQRGPGWPMEDRVPRLAEVESG